MRSRRSDLGKPGYARRRAGKSKVAEVPPGETPEEAVLDLRTED